MKTHTSVSPSGILRLWIDNSTGPKWCMADNPSTQLSDHNPNDPAALRHAPSRTHTSSNTSGSTQASRLCRIICPIGCCVVRRLLLLLVLHHAAAALPLLIILCSIILCQHLHLLTCRQPGQEQQQQQQQAKKQQQQQVQQQQERAKASFVQATADRPQAAILNTSCSITYVIAPAGPPLLLQPLLLPSLLLHGPSLTLAAPPGERRDAEGCHLDAKHAQQRRLVGVQQLALAAHLRGGAGQGRGHKHMGNP